MPYVYTLELKFAKTSANINLTEYTTVITEAISEYNKTGESATNPKHIELNKIDNKFIWLHLTSTSELKVAGKALRFFSQLIINKAPILADNLTTSGQLFRINQIGLPIAKGEDPNIQLQAKEVDDACLIKALVDYISKKRDPNTSTYIK